MIDRKVQEIGELLRREESEFIDYPTIAQKASEHGFPTSVRTLRFYVNERILPPPRRYGKSAVYKEKDILSLLLAIHLMKTRFQLSLAEIKTILGYQTGDPEVLADKCSLLYEEIERGRRLQRVEQDWLVDAFFQSLTGRMTLYPRSRRGEPGPRQAGEILITEIIEDLDRLARWEPDAGGHELRWIPPGEVLRAAGEGAAAWDRRGGAMGSGTSRRAAGEEFAVTPLTPPEGAITVDDARRREEHFLERFERNLAQVPRVFHPIEKKHYAIKPSALDPEVDDPYQRVVEVLKRLGNYDRALLERLPHDRSTRYALPPRGLFGKRKPRIVIAGIARSPIAELARLGGVLEPLPAGVLQDTIQEHLREPAAYHVLGVLSTVGWDPAVRATLPRGENFAVVLVEQTEGGGWDLSHTLPKKLHGLLALFDPEDLGEKVSRAFYRIVGHPELKIPGGHVPVENLIEELRVTRDVLDLALKQVAQENPRIQRTEVSGREILKRDRF
ncbi:MAG: MerR family transcriptional regulator [Planctomycetota bacterium]